MLLGALVMATAMAFQANPRMAANQEQALAHMLADQWVRLARAIIESDPLTVPKIEAATLIAQECTATAPEHAPAWRFLLNLADLGEDRDLQMLAVENLARLEPADEVIRLRRLNHEIDKLSTAEERVAMYERLLRADRREEIGAAVASRLALDLALLKQAQGDFDGFSRWLAEATAIDASNRRAAAMAAGFFRANVDDPIAEAELLISLAMADPTDALSMFTLSQVLLEHGAFDGADRMYQQGLKIALRTGAPQVNDALIADAAIAQWGRGDASGALRTMLEHQRMMDAVLRNRKRQETPDLTPVELSRMTATLSPTLASVRALIQSTVGGDLARATLDAAVASYDAAISSAAQEEDADPAAQARLLLEQASIMLWLGSSADEATSRIAQAAALQPLTPEAQRRFDGWIALRSGDAAAARASLQPLAERDSMAAIGFALALLEDGEQKESARQLLAVARQQPGTLLGVWAYSTLVDTLGQRFSVSKLAAQLNQLVADIPNVFDRYVDDPSLVVSLRMIPTKTVYAPFEPILIELEISNHTSVPLAIDRDGPLRPHLALLTMPSFPQSGRVQVPGELPPYIVDITRQLRIMPRERMRITVDLRQTQLATVLDANAIRGATVMVRGLMNFVMTPNGALRVGVLGSELQTDRLRIDGVRISRDWLEDVMARITAPDSADDLVQLALLGPIVAAGPSEMTNAEDRALLTSAAEAFFDAFPKLSPNAQAWLLGVIPKTQTMDPVRAIARGSSESAVQLSYMLHQATGASDPIFDAVARSEHPRMSRIAEMFIRVLRSEDDGDADGLGDTGGDAETGSK